MKLNIVESYNPSVTVITPSMGSDKLLKCAESVAQQTYENIEHVIVYDGHGNQTQIKSFPEANHCVIPFNTGGAKGGPFYGHRIYAAFSHLVNSDLVFFCDEDNWYEPEHVANAVATFQRYPYFNIVYSLRKIFSPEAEFLCEDNCESLGTFAAWTGRNLADTSSLAFRRDFLIQTAALWHSGWGGDARYLNAVTQEWSRPIITGTWQHTLCYRLDGNPNSVTQDFFERGNAKMLDAVNGKKELLPWIHLRNQLS